MAFVANLYVLS